MLLQLPAHFWDGTGGAVIGGLLSFGAAMVVLFATRNNDLKRMRLDASVQSARSLTPRLGRLVTLTDTAVQYPNPATSKDVLDALNDLSADLLALTSEVPRRHPYLRPEDVEALHDAANFLALDSIDWITDAVNQPTEPDRAAAIGKAGRLIGDYAVQLLGYLGDLRRLGPDPRRSWWRRFSRWMGIPAPPP